MHSVKLIMEVYSLILQQAGIISPNELNKIKKILNSFPLFKINRRGDLVGTEMGEIKKKLEGELGAKGERRNANSR